MTASEFAKSYDDKFLLKTPDNLKNEAIWFAEAYAQHVRSNEVTPQPPKDAQSKCCGAAVYSPNGTDFYCAQCRKPCEFEIVPPQPSYNVLICPVACKCGTLNDKSNSQHGRCYNCGEILEVTPQPASPSQPERECINCDWRGLQSQTVHPKHDPDTLLCPDCYEVTEVVVRGAESAPVASPQDIEVQRALRVIAGWFGYADEAEGRAPDELGRYMYERERETNLKALVRIREITEQRLSSPAQGEQAPPFDRVDNPQTLEDWRDRCEFLEREMANYRRNAAHRAEQLAEEIVAKRVEGEQAPTPGQAEPPSQPNIRGRVETIRDMCDSFLNGKPADDAWKGFMIGNMNGLLEILGARVSPTATIDQAEAT